MIFNLIAHKRRRLTDIVSTVHYIGSSCQLWAIALTHCKYTTFVNTTNIYTIFFLLTCINFDSII